MSAKLGTLTLDLIAKIGSFTGPIKEAEKQTEVSFTSMRKHVSTYGAIAVTGAAAVGAGVLAMANEYANAAREIQIFSSISNANTQEFQKMAAGAETVGIPMDKLSDQLKDFNEKLGEFVTIGSGGAVDFFEQIAVKTEGSAEGARKLALEMQNLSGPKALQLYVDKLEEAGVTQQQMSFYLESMASDTTNLIPLLKNGGEGFKFWADAAERAGLMSEETIAKAGELKIQMKLLDLQVRGVKNQFIQGLMPALVSVSGAMSDGAVQTNLMADAGETLGDVFKGVAVFGIGVYATIKMLSNAMAGLAVDAVKAKQTIDMKAEGGTWADKLPGIKFAKTAILGAINVRAPDSATNMALQDNKSIADDSLAVIKKMYSGATDAATKAAAELIKNQQGVTSGSDEWIKKQNDAAKAAKENTKALKEQQEQARNSISHAYADREKQIQLELNEELKAIRKANFPNPSEYLEAASRKAYFEKQIYLSQLQYEINEFKLTEEQKLKYKTEIDQLMIQADTKLTEENKRVKLQALDEQYALELQKARFHAQNMRQTMQESISRLSLSVDDIFAKATMSPNVYDRWSLANDRSNAQVDLKNQRVSVEQDIMAAPADVYADDDERYEALLQAHQEYRDALAAIDVQYDQQVKDLAQSQYESQLSIWGSLLGQAQNTWSQMTQAVKDSEGEQSGSFKAMFLMQQAMAFGSAIVSAHLAAVQTTADITLPFVGKIPAASAILAFGYANAGLIAGQTIAGMAHDGIDNIPQEGTWLLDKGERVVDSRTNSDLKNYLADGGGSKAPNVNVYTLPGQTADVSWDDGELDVRIRKVARETIVNDANNPNSGFGKAIKQNFNVTQKR